MRQAQARKWKAPSVAMGLVIAVGECIIAWVLKKGLSSIWPGHCIADGFVVLWSHRLGGGRHRPCCRRAQESDQAFDVLGSGSQEELLLNELQFA